MDRRMIVPVAGGIGLVYCTWQIVDAMLQEGWTAWGIAGAVVMALAAAAAFYIAWRRNKVIKAEIEALEKEQNEA